MHVTTTSAATAEAPPPLLPINPLRAALSTSILGAELVNAVSEVEARTIQPIFSQLERSSLKVPEGCLTFLELASLIRATEHIRTCPVICIETFQDSEGGESGHEYTVVTLQLPPTATSKGPRRVYVRLDVIAGARSGILTTRLSDQPGGLTNELTRRTCALKGVSMQRLDGGPSADMLAALLVLVEARMGRGYAPLGRDSMWLSELLFFCFAARFRTHWLGGRAEPPDAMRRYLHGDIGALAAAREAKTQGGAARWFAHAGLTMVRGLQTAFTQGDKDRWMMPDDEIAEVVKQWEACACLPVIANATL